MEGKMMAAKLAAALVDERIGTVLVFKHGVSALEATAALDKIAEVLDQDNCEAIMQFDPRSGWPAWYIP